MESEDVNKKVSLDEENGDGEHKRIFSEETRSSLSSSSSSSSSSSYLSPPKDLPESSSSNEPEISPIDSPPVQVMDRDADDDENNESYDPNRIPSSVFERSRSNIPAEWSCTSNESLFSIHLGGRNSFTINGDLMKSGELYKSGELLAYSPSLPMPPPPGSEPKPVVVVVEESNKEEKVVVIEETSSSSDEEEEEEEKEKKRESQDQKEQQHPAVSWKTPSTSYRSNRSSNSTHSFSFPILAGPASESTKKVETEELKKQAKLSQESSQQQPEETEANQKPPMCKWFSCFHPCPWCCSCCPCS